MRGRKTALAALGILALLIALAVIFPGRKRPVVLRVAVAADFEPALRELARQYHPNIPVEIQISPGSSGNLFAQIRNGAPFDLFFSADPEYPQRIAETGKSGQPIPYARGHLVLWVPGGVNSTDGIMALSDPKFRRIAIANPEHAPYGKAAIQALRLAGLYDQVRPRLVMGENVGQAAAFVESGNAVAGLVSESQVLQRGVPQQDYWRVPESLAAPLQQSAVVLKTDDNLFHVHSFLQYVLSDEGGRVLKNYGFESPGAAR